MLLNFFMEMRVAVVCLVSHVSGFSLCDDTDAYLSMLLSMDIWIVSSFCYQEPLRILIAHVSGEVCKFLCSTGRDGVLAAEGVCAQPSWLSLNGFSKVIVLTSTSSQCLMSSNLSFCQLSGCERVS